MLLDICSNSRPDRALLHSKSTLAIYSSQASTSTKDSDDQKTMGFVARIRSRSSRPVLGVGLSLHSLPVAQVAATSGADFVFIDMEHAPLSAESATQIVHTVAATSRGACDPLVRVPSHGVEWIKWALDSGAAGIIIPMVDDVAQMRAIVDRAVYPPTGRRSFGPSLAPYADPDGPKSGVPGYMARAANGDIAILPMIESREGLANVDEILAVDGVSGVFIGPVDLRLALGLPGGLDGSESEFTQALETVVAAARRRNKVVGTVAMGKEMVRKRTSDGMDFVVATADFSVLAAGIQDQLATAKRGINPGGDRSTSL